jgi:hypothetical protein
LGASWHSGCPVAPSGLRAVTVPYYGFDGKDHSGTIIVAASVAADVLEIFTQLHQMRFPIRSIIPVSAFGADDEKSMEADNSSAFNCRAITGGTGWSKHSYGVAIDINTRENPYISGSTMLPTNAAAYADRSRTDPGMIHAGDAVVRLFARHGWSWGGNWSRPKDYQHFER